MRRLPFFVFLPGFKQGKQADQNVDRLGNTGDYIQNPKGINGPKDEIDQNAQADCRGLFGKIGADGKLYAGDDGQQTGQPAGIGP